MLCPTEVRKAILDISDSDFELLANGVLEASERKFFDELRIHMTNARWFTYSEPGWYSSPDVRGKFKEVPIWVAKKKTVHGILVDEAHLGPVLLIYWSNLYKARTSMYVKVQDGKLVEMRFGEPNKVQKLDSAWAAKNNMSVVTLDEAERAGVSKVICLNTAPKLYKMLSNKSQVVMNEKEMNEEKEWKWKKNLRTMWKFLRKPKLHMIVLSVGALMA